MVKVIQVFLQCDAIELLNDLQMTGMTKQKVGLGMGEGKETATESTTSI